MFKLFIFVIYSNLIELSESIQKEGSYFTKDLNPQLAHLSPQELSTLQQLSVEYQMTNSEILAKITKMHSMDIASYFFLQFHYNKAQNKLAYQTYLRHLHNIEQQVSMEDFTALQAYYIAFVPGFGYKEDTTTGADFARQRALLSEKKIPHQLIEIDEWGLAEDNAKFVANSLRKINAQHQNIIIVSASKGGLETCIALGKYLKPKEVSNVKHWISVGGILRGSPLADPYLSGYKYWFAKFMLFIKRKPSHFLKEISFQYRNKSYASLNFPKHIQRVHFVGIPLSNDIGEKIQKRHESLVPDYGPNDGLTPISEELTEGGLVIAELGLDHYFQDPQIDQKTIALALMAIGK